jgi:hypothetical protein
MWSLDFFQLTYRNMAMVLTQSLTEMRTRNILGGKGRPARKADILASIYEPIV